MVSLSEAGKGEIKEGKNKEIEGMNRLLFVDISNEPYRSKANTWVILWCTWEESQIS